MAQDYTQDPAFLNAPPEQQHGYLAATNPAYAQAPPEVQKAYIDHVNGGTHGERTAALTPPIAGVTHATPQKGVSGGEDKNKAGISIGQKEPLGVAIGMREAEEPSEEAIGRATGAIGTFAPAMVYPLTTAGGLIGGTIGAPLVSSGARRTVGALGGSERAQDIAGRIGGYAGAIGGGLLGGGAAGSFEGLPEESTIAGIKFRTPSFLRKSPFEPSEGYSNPLGPEKGEFEAQQEAQLIKEGKLAKIPARLPKKPPTPEDIANRSLEVGKAKSQLVHGRPFEQLNEQEQSEALMRRGREQGQIDKAQQTEIERETSTRGNEGTPARWTNERVYELARQGNKDAVMELRQRGLEPPPNTRYVSGDVNFEKTRTGPLARTTLETEPTTITPGSKVRGVRVGQPRETVHFDEQGNPINQAAGGAGGGSEGTVGKGPVGAKTRSFEPTQTYTKPQFAGAADMPGYDKYVDALIAKGVDRNTAYQIADEDITLSNKPDYFNTVEREASLARMKRILGPEQRGPVRLGPEARGIK